MSDGTVCPLCAVGCRLDVGDGDRAVGRTGPANPGGTLCEKGIRAPSVLDDPDRLTTPLVREDGDLVEASWGRALDRAADGLRGVLDEYGADALAFLGAPHCTNEENYRLQKLARVLGTNNVDNRARACHEEAADALIERFGYPATTFAAEDLENTDLLLAVGANPAVQQPVFFDSFVRPAVNRGDATLVQVDPRENETTRLAAHHVAPRPGSDARFLQAVCARLVERGDVDETFLDERTTGYEAYADAVSSVDPVRAAAETGVSADAVDAVADAVAEADRVAVLAATGVENDEGATPNALLDLLALTGNVGRPGTGFGLLRGLNNEQGATDAGCRPDGLPGHAPLDDAGARERLADAWGVEPPREPGLTEKEALPAFGEDVRGALVVGENPGVSKRDEAEVAERLDALDTLVVLDVFESETTAHADVVLPAAVGLEKPGTVTSLDRLVQRLSPRADPPGDARTDHAILGGLGRRLAGDAFAGDIADTARELAAVSDLHGGPDGERWPPADGGGTDTLYTESFATPDGRARFVEPSFEASTIPEDAFALVVASRAGGFGMEAGDDRLRLNADDAAELGVEDGERVAVSTVDGDASVEAVAHVTDGIRAGTVALHADAADPLVRAGATAVRVD
ncbi:molybdopterin-dependent oxidoreductase [Salarchaeum sp. III]|uniref:molybdopterin oxidoreductase family protein n=1 Tax=Salarchaeum sp. III TaxID=3107927 RepID=UPI002EDA02C2